jgi:outer membrane protein TolC
LRRSTSSCPVLLAWAVCWLFAGPSPARSETLSLESVLERALEHAWEIRIAEKDIGIREYGLMEARSAHYPTLSLRFDNEYVDFLGDGESIVSVGEQVSANDASTFQHSFTLGISFVLYDFGARGQRLEKARREIDIAGLGREEALLETRLSVLEAYGQGLQLFRQRQITAEMVRLRKEVFKNLQSLREAGTVGQVRLNSAAVELAEGISLSDVLTDRLVKALESLGYLTGEDYPLDETLFAGLPPVPSTDRLPDLASLPQVRSIDAEIARARAERSVVLREMLPNIGLTAGYRMFGADADGFGSSLESLSARDATVALVARWELFSGFRDVARLNQLQLQVEQLRLEKGRRLNQLQQQVRAASRIWQLAEGTNDRHDQRQEVLKQSGEALERLSEQRLIDRVTYLEQQVELMEQERDMETTQLQRRLAGWQLSIWAEGQRP